MRTDRAADLLTHPDAASAEDAEAVVAVDERIVPADLAGAAMAGEGDPVEAHGLDDPLELAAAVGRAEDAPGHFTRLADGRLQIVAGRFFRADQAGVRVFGQDELEDAPPEGQKVGRRSDDVHPLLGRRAASGDVALPPLDLDEAETAGGVGGEPGMVA